MMQNLHCSRRENLKPTTRFVDKLSAVFGLGFMPVGPGTWGSLPGIPLAWLVYYMCQFLTGGSMDQLLGIKGVILAAIVGALLCWGSTWCIAQTEKEWNSHDDKSIVIDEVIGQMVALVWFPPSVSLAVVGFILFRFFDILKPGPIGWVDRHWETPFGTLLDDLIAGGCAGFLLIFLWQLQQNF